MKQLIPLSSRRPRIRMALVAGSLLLLINVTVFTRTSWASGVSASERAQMSADNAALYPLAFDSSIEKAITSLQASGFSSQATTFYDSYLEASQDYGTALLSAADAYTAASATDPAGARNAYIDNFSSARAIYFNRLEEARNRLISETSGNDVARNSFTDQYNAARDLYNNQLESVKNDIAALQV